MTMVIPTQTGVMILPTSSGSSAPDSYDFGFETNDGIEITVTVDTDNESRAETIRKEIEQQMAWKGRSLEDDEPSDPSYAGAFGWALLSAIIVPLIIGFVGTLFGFAWYVASLPTPESFQDGYDAAGNFIERLTWMETTGRAAVFSAPVAFIVTLITECRTAYRFNNPKPASLAG